MVAASTTAFSFFSLLGFLLVLIPLPWHLEAWNTGTLLFMFWTGLGSLNFFINSIIWRNNAINWAPVWCDISSKFIVGLGIGIPTASLCINRRLYNIAAVRSVTKTRAEKRRGVIIDLCIGLGIPIIVMVLHYVVQGHRFNIFEEYGCFPYTYNTALSYILIQAPTLAAGLISGTYAILSLIALRRRHAEFKQMLKTNTNLNSSRYFRLMALASIDVMFSVPICLVAIIVNATNDTIRPWISWEDTHWGFSRVDQFPSVLWKADPRTRTSLELCRWVTICCALVFFGFFGFADEAQKHYRSAFESITKRVGISTSSGNTTKVGSGATSSLGKFKAGISSLTASKPSLPIYVSQEVMEKRDSLESDLTSIKDTDFGGSERATSPFSTLTKNQAQEHLAAADATQPGAPTPATTASRSFLDLSTAERADNRV